MSKFGEELIESLTQAVAQARGEVPPARMHYVAVPDVRAIRRALRMSQERFAATYGIPLPTLKDWEQGRQHPDALAKAYLQAIAKCPDEIRAALTVSLLRRVTLGRRAHPRNLVGRDGSCRTPSGALR